MKEGFWQQLNKFSVISTYITKNRIVALDGGVAQWTSHPPQEQKTRVPIPPGCKDFGQT
jgi:hypothetical protein